MASTGMEMEPGSTLQQSLQGVLCKMDEWATTEPNDVQIVVDMFKLVEAKLHRLAPLPRVVPPPGADTGEYGSAARPSEERTTPYRKGNAPSEACQDKPADETGKTE